MEFAKYYLFEDVDFKKAKKYLDKIVYKKNADWFSCYRAFYLFFLFDNKNKIFWKDMLLSCHPNFPLILLKKKLSNFQNIHILAIIRNQNYSLIIFVLCSLITPFLFYKYLI